MGLLSSDTSLTWEEIQEYADYIREHGITQFLNLWREQKDQESDPLLWGDEIEYMVVSYDNQSQSARLSLRQNEILHELHKSPHNSHGSSGGKSAEFDPEYTRYQLESAPGASYNSSMSDLLVVERNMRCRRERIRGHLSSQEVLVTVSSFPSLGAAETFTEPPIDPGDPNSRRSSSFLDEIISHHTRYRGAAALKLPSTSQFSLTPTHQDHFWIQ